MKHPDAVKLLCRRYGIDAATASELASNLRDNEAGGRSRFERMAESDFVEILDQLEALGTEQPYLQI